MSDLYQSVPGSRWGLLYIFCSDLSNIRSCPSCLKIPEMLGFGLKQAYGGLKEPIGDADAMFGSKFVVTSTKVLNFISGIFLPHSVACRG